MRQVHLVGSSPFRSADEAFEIFGKYLSECTTRFPDGETGERVNWGTWQKRVLQDHPKFEVADQIVSPRNPSRPFVKYKLKDGVDVRELSFGPLGYAEAARASFEAFKRKQAEGRLPQGARFQVSLPTPLCFIDMFFLDASLRELIEPIYRSAMIDEVHEMAKSVPADQLAIQWDVAVELHRLEKLYIDAHSAEDTAAADAKFEILVERTTELCNAVPARADLLIHLCYGDFGHRHTIEPPSLRLCTRVTNAVVDRLRRPLDLVHMPVPRDRQDAEYFAPLSDIRISAKTKLCLGLIHLTDGLAGLHRRLDRANAVVHDFAIATECGMGRRPRESMDELLELHRIAAQIAG